MYIEIVFISILGISFSWWKFRDVLHPHFMLTMIMFFMFFSDFLIRGYEDKNIASIDIESVSLYQQIIVATVSTIYISTYICLRYFYKAKKTNLLNLIALDSKNSSQILPLCAWTILLLETLKRLYFSGWSISLMLSYSFGPRFNRPWASSSGNLGDEKFIFAFIGIVLPLAGLILVSNTINTNKFWNGTISAFGYLAILSFVIGAGSRTPAVLLIVLPLIHFFKKTRSKIKRAIAVILAMGMIASTTSVMYNGRTDGLMSSDIHTGKIVYHQDDSYYRAISTMNTVANTHERWELTPFLGASLLNFIPRVVWPEKPTLSKEYWGNFKLDYVTITFIAELSALLGIAGGVTVSVLVGITSFLFLVKLHSSIKSSYDLLLYVLGAIYVYMVFRSLLNITQFIYMLALFYILLKIDNNIFTSQKRKTLRSLAK